MKRLPQIFALGLFSLLLVAPAVAETEEGAPPEALPAALTEAVEANLTQSENVAPAELSARPDPVFLAGSSAGGAGGLKTGLVNGDSAGSIRTRILYEDHTCCPYGWTGCDCSYSTNQFCDPIGCPKRTQPDCSN